VSQRPISHSPDLSRLRAEGFDIRVEHGHLVVRDVPYLDAGRQVVRGTLVKPLTLTGDVAESPRNDHTIFLTGPRPYDAQGRPLDVVNSEVAYNVPGLTAQFRLSRKPAGGYADYYQLVTTYVSVLSKHVRELDPAATAQTHPVVVPDEDDPGPFHYIDTASARAGITAVNVKVASDRIAIVGLGGTGAYILDLIVKSPVQRIDLYDGDVLMQHNAFRYPGAVPIEVVQAKPMKVNYLAERYSVLHRQVVPHPCYVTEANVEEILAADFVFLAIDDNPSRALIAHRLEAAGKPFIDVGLGLFESDGSIGGQLRVTTSVPGHRDHLWDERHRLPTQALPEDLYDQNVQIVDLNALNAALAVGRWKRHVGIFADLEGEHHSLYVVDGNDTINEDK